MLAELQARAQAVTPRDLAAFRRLHDGATVLVCVCGASLDLVRAKPDCVTIGVNDMARAFTPDYLVVVNPRGQFSTDRLAIIENTASLRRGLGHCQVIV